MPIARGHPHDMAEAEVSRATGRAERPDLLQELVQISRDSFGFFTKHFPSSVQYEWAARHLADQPRGSRFLEIGAGVNPLPLFFARRGIFVDCVDNSPIVRRLPVSDDWDPWGFFDYGCLNPRLTSFHRNIQSFVPRHSYDVIYAMGSIATMTAEDRQGTFRLVCSWLLPGGSFLISLGLIAGTDQIWNHCRGEEVEPLGRHGRIDDALRQLVLAGFEQLSHQVVTIENSRNDLLLINCRASQHSSGI
jgi:hypothetical protein